jgi:hypothetical protein
VEVDALGGGVGGEQDAHRALAVAEVLDEGLLGSVVEGAGEECRSRRREAEGALQAVLKDSQGSEALGEDDDALVAGGVGDARAAEQVEQGGEFARRGGGGAGGGAGELAEAIEQGAVVGGLGGGRALGGVEEARVTGALGEGGEQCAGGGEGGLAEQGGEEGGGAGEGAVLLLAAEGLELGGVQGVRRGRLRRGWRAHAGGSGGDRGRRRRPRARCLF